MVSEEYVRHLEQELLRKGEQVKELLIKCAEMKKKLAEKEHEDGCDSA